MSDIPPLQSAPLLEDSATLDEVQAALWELEHRHGDAWWVAVIVIVLLTAAIGSFAITVPSMSEAGQRFAGLNLINAVRGLASLILLFIIYAIYQQVSLKKMRARMVKHLEMLARAKSQAEEFRMLATVDPLTGLHNRRNAEQLLAGEMARSQRYNLPLAVLMLDLNGFKQINDRYGHAIGDVVLREFASRLKTIIRGSDTAIRMGGDEFLVLLPGALPEEAQYLVRRLGKSAVHVGQTVIEVTFAAGSAGCVKGESSGQILERADRALYAQKRREKNQPPAE
jgi:diguanylate cyclase (GGDEF)-like protein